MVKDSCSIMTEGTHALRAEYTPMGKKISGDGHEYSRK
jgi:hypothetical protein